MLSIVLSAWLPQCSINKALFGFKKSRRDGLLILKAVEKDSESDIEREKAREALRKLDEQLLSLSTKQASPPKIRAVDMNQSSSREEDNTSEIISGSLLTYLASSLLVFTILYNVIFLTVIKPAIDGPETVQYADIVKEAQQGAPQ